MNSVVIYGNLIYSVLSAHFDLVNAMQALYKKNNGHNFTRFFLIFFGSNTLLECKIIATLGH